MRFLKFSSRRAETSHVDVDLFDLGDPATPRPAWQLIEAARRRYLTGLLVLDTAPTTNVYLRDGQVYFADRSTDGGLGVRLLVEGVITREQMHKATLQVSGIEHLGRMFERDASIDREAVELCVELMTDDVLTHVADSPVTSYRMHMYKRHPSGLDRWLPTRVEVVTHVVSDGSLLENGTNVAPGDGPRSRPHLTPPPATGEVKIPTPTITPAYVPTAAATPVVKPESTPAVDPAPATTVAPVVNLAPAEDRSAVDRSHSQTFTEDIEQAHEVSAERPVTKFASVPPAAFTTLQVPAVSAGDYGSPASSIVDTSQMESFSGSLADEVAEAVRRALAAIDSP